MELTTEEKALIEAFRKLSDFGRLEIVKDNGRLLEFIVTQRTRLPNMRMDNYHNRIAEKNGENIKSMV